MSALSSVEGGPSGSAERAHRCAHGFWAGSLCCGRWWWGRAGGCLMRLRRGYRFWLRRAFRGSRRDGARHTHLAIRGATACAGSARGRSRNSPHKRLKLPPVIWSPRRSTPSHTPTALGVRCASRSTAWASVVRTIAAQLFRTCGPASPQRHGEGPVTGGLLRGG